MTETVPDAYTADGSTDPRAPLLAMIDQMTAAGRYEIAADIGASFPDDESRIDTLTGNVAHGYAFVPGTRFPLSHGSTEARPTPFQRWMRGERPAARVANAGAYLDLRLARTDHGAAQGGEAIVRMLGLTDPGAEVEFDIKSDEIVVRRRRRS
jgi:hypothetical protein